METNRKEIIRRTLLTMREQNEAASASLTDRCTLEDYRALTFIDERGRLRWEKALQAAIREHEITVIPPCAEPYYIGAQIRIPSDRRIEAAGACIRQTEECTLLMLANEHTHDGTHAPIDTSDRDRNIAIIGGRWEESRTARAGYGRTGKYDEERSFYGVSTLFFFNNLDGLTLRELTFAHTAGFAVQTGDLRNACFEHIRFESCYADGLHMNGNSENLLVRDVKGEVGDDLVALNMYDWQNSSVNFGPTKTVLCEDLELSDSSPYKAIRIEPGTYYFDDGSAVDCSLTDAIFKTVRGIRTFKLYYQTPRYPIGGTSERGAVGSADHLYFEDIEIDLRDPIDHFDEYMNSDPIRGSFAGFELGANIGHMELSDIRITLYKECFPYSYLLCIGPKSVRNQTDGYEIFDPALSGMLSCLELHAITVNGQRAESTDGLVREIVFDDLYGDGCSTASGRIEKLLLDGIEQKQYISEI